jgi:hypothetical protein
VTSGEGSVSYEVTLEIEPELLPDVVRELREHHIPEILKTGCFSAVRLDRIDDGRLRTRYEAASTADLDRYLKEYTAHFRADFMARFPAGVGSTREVWQFVEQWRRRE